MIRCFQAAARSPEIAVDTAHFHGFLRLKTAFSCGFENRGQKPLRSLQPPMGIAVTISEAAASFTLSDCERVKTGSALEHTTEYHTAVNS